MANRHGGRDNVTVVVVDVLEGRRAAASRRRSSRVEPGWPGSETTGTMIDADADSVRTLQPASIAVPTGEPVPPVDHVADGPTSRQAPRLAGRLRRS